MSRARVTALALVNWKGVFYERYLLDRHVTALEGANGAGKTTVMIAAYVALLPDMSRLRFTNLGETGATGGDRGIFGRLGEPGRPSYTVLDLLTGEDERVLAGIRLVRTTPPTVEPTPFLVTGLDPEVRLSDLLLERQLDGDHVPELDAIASAVKAAGGAIEIFKTTKDYFAALFERGITPMRLATEEERGKLNEMLKTSMTGGISRALTSELRGFLLKEETGLGDALARMRANLDACRRTRAEVAESRILEREISAVFEAGSAMFAAAVHAARAGAAEATLRIAANERAVEDTARTLRNLDDELVEIADRERELAIRAAAARTALERAIAERDRRVAMRAVEARLRELATELIGLDANVDAARAQQGTATAERARVKQERERAAAAYDRASHGLAHLQEGLDELVLRAHAHRQFVRRLADARELADRPALEADGAAAVSTELDGERARLHAERARLDRDTRDLESRRTEYEQARTALVELAGEASEDLHARARQVLADLADLENRAGRAHDLERERAEAARLAERQDSARALATTLGLPVGEAGAGRIVVSALATLESELRATDELERGEAAAALAMRQELEDLRHQLARLDDRGAKFQLVSLAASRLAIDATTPARLTALRDQLADDHHALARQRAALEADRAELQRRAAELDQGGTNNTPELLQLRDDLGGELLASRFEDVDVATAAWIEARLGPLCEALIVEDPDAAAVQLAATDRDVPTVYLVRAGTALAVEPPEDLGSGDVIVTEPFGVRVTRRPQQPMLGRRSRERHAAGLRIAIERAGAELDTLGERAHSLATARRDIELVVSQIDVLELGDPALERTRLAAKLAALEATDRARRERLSTAHTHATSQRARLDGLRRLLGDAALLEEPDHTARATMLATQSAEVLGARDQLARVAGPRKTLAALLDILRHPPLGGDALAAAVAKRDALDARLDRLFQARVALDDVLAHRHAASWTDAEAALAQTTQLAPALERQHTDARAAVQAVDAAAAAADAAWETATSALQSAEALQAAATAHRDRAAAELAALGPIAGTSDRDELQAAGANQAAIDAEARSLVSAQTLASERREQTARALEELRARTATEQRAAGPLAAAWDELRATLEGDGLLAAVVTAPGATGRTSVQLIADAWSKHELLVDRVARSRGGDELASELRELTLETAGYVRGWRATREWLRRRVPAQVAEVDDPLIALERLRDHLDLLDGRLARQEADLRGASEDVARGIDVQVRRAHGQVRRLNERLADIKFGSIHGIRVEIRRVDRMEQILRALRKGEGQELLFQSSLPIEEALDEIFRRYGGGGRSGGQRLLDYREYVELAVEIRRQTSETWESASPTKLSTGEAIGVGAALMMVVLTEWERDANLLRAKRTSGSLRFLFLDEANRLSRDNLGVLFDLCRVLDLQLLIAAPEVARAEGNTTYRLVRHLADNGSEEVIVSGRRAAPTDPRPLSESTPSE